MKDNITTIDSTLSSVSSTGTVVTECDTAYNNFIDAISQIPTGTADQQMPAITYGPFDSSATPNSFAPASIGSSATGD